jgi:ABC-type proline/glycine betaine transport system permease subunit
MRAIVSGLLDLLQWLAATVANFFSWLGSTIVEVARWVLRLIEYPLVWLWNAVVDVITWTLSASFWFLGHVVELPLVFLIALASLLPSIPPDFHGSAHTYIIPAYNIANRIFPIPSCAT